MKQLNRSRYQLISSQEQIVTEIHKKINKAEQDGNKELVIILIEDLKVSEKKLTSIRFN